MGNIELKGYFIGFSFIEGSTFGNLFFKRIWQIRLILLKGVLFTPST